jgi:hypothetical protein
LIAAAVAGITSTAIASAPPANAPVSDTQPFDYQSPSIAVNPRAHRQVAVAYFERTQTHHCLLGLSSNGGASWSSFVLIGAGGMFPIPGGQSRCTEARALYTPDGTLYYIFNASSFATGYSALLYVTISKDGGKTFSTPQSVDTTQPPASATVPFADDEPKFTVDPSTGIVYGAWTRYSSDFSESEVVFGYVRQGSTTFSQSKVVSPLTNLSADIPAVAARAGRVYYGYEASPTNGAPGQQISLVTSTDNGASFSPAQTIDVPPACTSGLTCNDAVGDQTFSLAAGPPATDAFLSYTANVGDTTVNPRIHFSATHDGGRSWSAGRVIGVPADRPNHIQILSSISEAPDGRLDVAYYDLTPDHRYEDTYLTYSSNEGATFSVPQRISNTTSDTTIAPKFGFGNDRYAGNLVDSTNDGAYVAWTDSRRASLTNIRQDVFFAKLPFSARPALIAHVKKRTGSRATSFSTGGRLVLPAGVPSSACTGRVSILIKHGSRTVSRRRVALRKNCSYRQQTSVPSSRLSGRGRNEILARFLGNKVLRAVSARRRFA